MGDPVAAMRSLRFLLAATALVTAATAQDGLPGTARLIDGRSLTGALAVADGRATLVTTEGPVAFDLAEMTAFEAAQAIAVPIAADHRVWLRSGLELPVTRLTGVAGAPGKPAMVTIATPGGLVFDVPLTTVRAIRQGGKERPEPPLFAADLRQPPSSDDLIFVVKDGKAQRSVVTVKALTAERIDFLLRGDAFEFELAGLAGVVFGATTGFPPDRQPRPRTRVALTSGELLEGRLLTLAATGLQCRLDEGAVVDVPAARVLSLQVASDRLAWLTEMQPRVEQTPAFDRVWPWTVDRSPVGQGLVLGGKTFARGLCLVPRTRLTYDLGGRFDVFEATIGIDDRGGPEAHAILRVLVDDKVVFDSGPRTRGQAPETIRLELQKAKTLALEADFGKNYDLGDYCVFADPRVVQK